MHNAIIAIINILLWTTTVTIPNLISPQTTKTLTTFSHQLITIHLIIPTTTIPPQYLPIPSQINPDHSCQIKIVHRRKKAPLPMTTCRLISRCTTIIIINNTKEDIITINTLNLITIMSEMLIIIRSIIPAIWRIWTTIWLLYPICLIQVISQICLMYLIFLIWPIRIITVWCPVIINIKLTRK